LHLFGLIHQFTLNVVFAESTYCDSR